MKQHVKFYAVTDPNSLMRDSLVEVIKDCRDKERKIKFYSGINRGKRYPYSSTRQQARQMKAHARRVLGKEAVS